MAQRTWLLIDDDEDDHEIFLAALQHVDPGINCIAEKNAKHALDNLSSANLLPDLIFLDLNMPVMNGYQFLSELRKKELLRAIPVVIFSTSAESIAKDEIRELGVSEFITKPDKITALVVILSKVSAKYPV